MRTVALFVKLCAMKLQILMHFKVFIVLYGKYGNIGEILFSPVLLPDLTVLLFVKVLLLHRHLFYILHISE
jgi:hypothetical protein